MQIHLIFLYVLLSGWSMCWNTRKRDSPCSLVLVLLYRIGYCDRMSNLYATDNKVNVNQSNMKLKYILNAIIFVLALSFLSMCIFKTTELSLKCMQFAVSISCIGAMFSTKRYRYIFASIALIIIGISLASFKIC